RRRRFVGPEPRDIGIFNLDNRHLFTHELMDDYTSVYTSSETPFVAYATVMRRRYEADTESNIPFVSEDAFRSAWFAYVDLQDFSGDMQCPRCGPRPEAVIWDGVSAGFNQKQCLPSIRPPIISDDDAPVRPNGYIGKQQVIPDANLRRDLRRLVKRGKMHVKDRDDEGGDDGDDYQGMEQMLNKSDATIKDELERIQLIPDVHLRLSRINGGLGSLFNQYFGQPCATAPPKPYQDLFFQVSVRMYCMVKFQ
ncbi:hypothetical protein H0H81_002434, partial [Sphagnurus paluster]